ncbi:kinase-like protein [Metschnikowia bicuspidata]|uniref:1-phosphatidylinositol 4-kinase n=1 Tax=Metschnikowia bicuspidata TaxID=27322 RepID=A0A4P9Z8S1_9ASCO|nr:kinase-like protein [Metschnikowia bicuspidata]
MNLLSRVNDENFDCLQCIHLISQNSGNIGIHQYLVKKLSTYKYSELEFLIPQLIQVLLCYKTESMALHDLILNLSKQYPHFCLLSFWNLQAYVFELTGQPESYSFHAVRGFINSLQDIMFNRSETNKHLQFRENLHPALMLGAALGATFGVPFINDYVGPIIRSQSRQQKSFLFKLANFQSSLTENLTLKNKGRNHANETGSNKSDGTNLSNATPKRYSESNLESKTRLSNGSLNASLDYEYEYDSDYTGTRSNVRKVLHSKKVNRHARAGNELHKASIFDSSNFPSSEERLTSLSLPDLSSEASLESPSRPNIPIMSWLSSSKLDQHISPIPKNSQVNNTEILKANYFKKEIEFMIALQNVSSALSQVPREARLTSLRAELSIINSSILPSQIDIPQLFPTSSLRNKKFHRILKLNVTEACVLNSAERVPYLLFIEYLSDDMDFDPNTDQNKGILSEWNSTDLKPSSKQALNVQAQTDSVTDLVEETDLADISAISLSIKLHPMTLDNGEGLISDESSMGERLYDPNIRPRHPAKTMSSNLKAKDLSSQIRIAAVMLKQLEKYGQANSEQSAAIRSRIVKSMKELQDQFETIDYEKLREISGNQNEQDAGERKLENDFKIGEDWSKKKERIRKTSIYGHLPHWDLCSVIVKNGDDLQQEALACQLITSISNIWKSDRIGVWTKDMKMVVTSHNSGLVETINNALSIHSIKKSMTEFNLKHDSADEGVVVSIKDYFTRVYGDESTVRYRRAQENFARSLAAYSIICYVLQIKDRHNGNIMLDNEGHIMHIDFGFILSNSPGSVGFEAAPFKLTTEYVEVLGGIDSKFYKLFVSLCEECFLSLRKHCEQLANLVDLMQKDSSLPCFKSGNQTSVLLKQRLQLEMSDEECRNFVEVNLIGKSLGSMYTRLYDQFQLLTQGIYT